MNTESKRLFRKPIIVGVTGWAILLFSVVTCFLVWSLSNEYLALYFCLFFLLIFLVVWTVVSIFGVLQGFVDYKELRFLKPYLPHDEFKKRKTLFVMGLLVNVLLILCNSALIFWLYKLWQRIFP
jgi:uncharacterized membrane protein